MINLNELMKQVKGVGEDVGPLRHVGQSLIDIVAILRWQGLIPLVFIGRMLLQRAWLEFIKHPESQVSYELAHQHETIREAKDELLVLSCNEKYRLYYEARLKALLDETSRLQTARDEGIEKGIAQGIEQEKLKNIKNCFFLGLSDEQIAIITELSIDEVKRLRKVLKV